MNLIFYRMLSIDYQTKDASYYKHSRPEIIPYVPSTIKKALDIGCSQGNFGMLLKQKFHCEIHGIEPDEMSAQAAEEQLDKVYHSLFDPTFVNTLNQKYDCIFFNDVLEHLTEPQNALILCKSILERNGFIIASIPNIRWYPVILSLLRYKDFKYSDAGVMDKTHLRFFTSKSMKRLFEECGYKVNIIEGINRHSFKFLTIANFLMFNQLADMHYPQFIIQAQLNE